MSSTSPPPPPSSLPSSRKSIQCAVHSTWHVQWYRQHQWCCDTGPTWVPCRSTIGAVHTTGRATCYGQHTGYCLLPHMLPPSQHFLVSSLLRPTISSVSEAGVIQTLISNPEPTETLIISPSSPISAIANPRRRIFASPLPSNHAGLAVDPSTGTAYVTTSNQILTVDLEGNISAFSVPVELGGVVHVNWGGIGEGRGVEVREGRSWVYLFVTEDGGSLGRWEDDGEHNVKEEARRWVERMLVLVCLDLGLVYFLCWKFQMGQLVISMNHGFNSATCRKYRI